MRVLFTLLIVLFCIPFIVIGYGISAAYFDHILPRESTRITNKQGQESVLDFYARDIEQRIDPTYPLIMIVPLNGTPDSLNHISYKNAAVALAVLQQVQAERKFLLLSEGNTLDPCRSGAEITAEMLGVTEERAILNDVEVVTEENAATTVENILFSKEIIQKRWPDQDVSILVAGMVDPFPVYTSVTGPRFFTGIDVGHAARAFLLLNQVFFGVPDIHLIGVLPTNRIDPSITNYPFSYNALTMVAGALGGLYLPYFDRQQFMLSIEEAGCR